MWKSSEVIVNLTETYKKQTLRSRCEIMTANGRIWLTVPVERPNGKQTQMCDVLIHNTENWRKDHIKAIESAYRKTPYYEFYADQLLSIIRTDFTYLWELNQTLTDYFVDKIGLTVSVIHESNNLTKESTHRFDQNFHTHRYIQPFEERHGFQGNLSVLDLLFNEGPNSISILQESFYS
ncbi:MAG: WbqC family protein [Crocinitomicaceae bacterium]|nr:WbqC family protein [Crocinitomicaceae bacterium]